MFNSNLLTLLKKRTDALPLAVQNSQGPYLNQQQPGQNIQIPKQVNTAKFERLLNGNTLVNGAISERPVNEDSFYFPNGGQFQPLPGGRAQLTNAQFPAGRFQEDDFTFPQAQSNLQRLITTPRLPERMDKLPMKAKRQF